MLKRTLCLILGLCLLLPTASLALPESEDPQGEPVTESEAPLPEPPPAPPETNDPEPPPESPPSPEPELDVEIKGLEGSLPAGKDAQLLLTIKNTGETPVQDALLEVKLSKGLDILSLTDDGVLKSLSPGEEKEMQLHVNIPEDSAQSQELHLKLLFRYRDGNKLKEGSFEDQFFFSVEPKKVESLAPVLVLSHEPFSSLTEGASHTMVVTLENKGKVPASDIVIRLTSSDEVFLSGGQSSVAFDESLPGSPQTFELEIQAAEKLSGKIQQLSADISYRFHNGKENTKESVREVLSVPVRNTPEETPDSPPPSDDTGGSWSSGGGGSGISTPKIDEAIPNVIITKFTYGADAVEAGASFDLLFDYTNTSKKISVENIVLSIEPDENFAIKAASNIVYIPNMKASATQQQMFKLQALPGAKTGSHSVEVSFKYDHVDGEKREQATMTQKLFIPVFQPDRFEISAPTLPETSRAQEEMTLSLPYVNKGKNEVANVEATIIGEVNSPVKVQNLGNFEAGKSGNISFIITPEKEGTMKFTLKVSYEDGNNEVKSKEFPVTLQVEASSHSEEDVFPEEEMPEEKPSRLPWILGSVLILSIIAGGSILFVKKRIASQEEDAWDDWEEGSEE